MVKMGRQRPKIHHAPVWDFAQSVNREDMIVCSDVVKSTATKMRAGKTVSAIRGVTRASSAGAMSKRSGCYASHENRRTGVSQLILSLCVT